MGGCCWERRRVVGDRGAELPRKRVSAVGERASVCGAHVGGETGCFPFCPHVVLVIVTRRIIPCMVQAWMLYQGNAHPQLLQALRTVPRCLQGK